jgi:fructose-bisphosphate aldolase, class I
LARGGSKASESIILKKTYELMKQGCKGIVYGRNVIQHKDPKKITNLFMSIVHNEKSIEDVLLDSKNE